MSSKAIPMTIDHRWIAAHIPHQGSMCLLDRVESWNETAIVCRANSNLLANNPLLYAGNLGITNGIEYAAQAMAVHGALLAATCQAPAAGFLISVRNVHWQRQRLDNVNGELVVRAERLSGNEINIIYNFSLHDADYLLLSGRASVILDAAGSRTPFVNQDKTS